jgi:hypothetical protein
MKHVEPGSPELAPAPTRPSLRVQRACTCGARTTDGGTCEACRQRVSRKAAEPGPGGEAPEDLLRTLGAGEPLAGGARNRMERALGHDFRAIRVHADDTAATAASDLGAHAFAVGEHVGFAAGQYAPGTLAGDALLAHELAHTVQQSGGAAGPSVADEVLEHDADRAALQAVGALYAGADPVAASTQRTAGNHLSLSHCGDHPQAAAAQHLTHDEAMVEKATRLLPLVRQQIAELHARRFHRENLAMQRTQIEDPLAAATGRPALERANMAAMNRAPLRVQLTGDAVVFHVRFQVRFENPSHADRLGTLRSAVQRAADTVWTSPSGEAMQGRSFRMETEVQAEDGPRNPDFWLIVVRNDDHDPVTHPGCNLPDPRPVVAAVTDSSCDGGVMNIPPRSVGNASLIGHEMLHLFGLVDRYLMTTSMPPPSTAPRPPGSPPPPPPVPIVGTTAMRSPGEGRRDPLGSEAGPILREDLAFIYENLGVFDRDEAELARRIGRDLGQAMRLESWCVETIRLGRDANRLFRPREDFIDRMTRDAEDL